MAYYVERKEVSVIPTEPTETGCYLKINTFFDPSTNPITIECNGITYDSGVDFTLSSYGHAYSGELFIPDLVELKHYVWTVNQNDFNDDGWVNRLPRVGEPHTVIVFSCDNNTNLTNQDNNNSHKVVGNWADIKKLIDSGVFVSLICGIDDFSGYIDQKTVSDTFEDASGYIAAASVMNTQDANDVSLAYMTYCGCTGASRAVLEGQVSSNTDLITHWGREENRAYVRNRIPRKVAAGDHEYAPDIGYTSDVTAGSNPRWLDYATKTPGQAHIGYNTMVNIPAAITLCNDGVTDIHANHWKIVAGNIKFISLDQVTNSDGTVQSGNAQPAQQATTIYGVPQLTDIKIDVNDTPSKFSVLLMTSGMMYAGDGVTSLNRHFAQYPLYNLCTAEWQFLFTNDTDGLASNKWFDGSFGTGLCVSGDLHRRNTLRYMHKAYTGNTEFNIEHWHTGTANGSSNFGNDTGMVVGDVFESTDNIAVLELLEDETEQGGGGQDYSFMTIEDIPNGNAKMRVSHYDTAGDISYQREYGVGHGNLSRQTFPSSSVSSNYSDTGEV